MKNNIKIIIISIIILFTSIVIADFLFVKFSNRLPILAIKKENIEKQYILHYGLFYKVYECKSNDIFIKPYWKKATCPNVIIFHNGYFTNSKGLRISLKEYNLISSVYGYNTLNNWIDNNQISDAIYIADKFYKSFYCTIQNLSTNEYNVIAFFDFNEENNKWECMNNNKEYYYCQKHNDNKTKYLYSKYENGNCITEWKPLIFEDRWCNLVKNDKDITFKDLVPSFCD